MEESKFNVRFIVLSPSRNNNIGEANPIPIKEGLRERSSDPKVSQLMALFSASN
ncbi:hypothetical protein D3C84_1293890 [compost metagenome]